MENKNKKLFKKNLPQKVEFLGIWGVFKNVPKDSLKKNSTKNVEFLGIWGERILKTVPKISLKNLFKKLTKNDF